MDRRIDELVDQCLSARRAYVPAELLIELGWLDPERAAAWRRGEIGCLREATGVEPSRLRAVLEAAAERARRLGLEPEVQEDGLRFAEDPGLQRLLATRFVPAEERAQLDLFVDNPATVAVNRVCEALLLGREDEAARLLAQVPEAAAERREDLTLLVSAARRVGAGPSCDMVEWLRREVDPAARRMLGRRAGGYVGALWRRLAEGLEGAPFDPSAPEAHASFAAAQGHAWAAVRSLVEDEPGWRAHPALCLRRAHALASAGDRVPALEAWFDCLWRFPEPTERSLDRAAPPLLSGPWDRFRDTELEPEAFPAWYLLAEPRDAGRLDAAAAPAEPAAARAFPIVAALASGDRDVELRRRLRAAHEGLFRHFMAWRGQQEWLLGG